MGIQGLLPFLKEATQPVNMSKYSGYAVAVDTYCWLHKGAFACSLQLAKGEPTDMYVKYCLKYVNMLRAKNVRPILVFDGCTLAAKKHVEKSRRERRELYNKKGRQFLREGKVSEARDCFNKCINVTPQMALEVMKAARSLGVDCIVAPYEADAQLAYLHKVGIVQAVITEDSDLVTFGCKRVIVKLDLNGNGLEIDSSKLHQAMKIGAKYTPEKFRYMCIVAGCDYLQSLPGIGLGKARKLFQLVTNPDLSQVLKRMHGTLKLKQSVSEEYIEGFHKANNTFLHQLAYDPRRRKLVPLNPYPDGVDSIDMEYAGKYMEEQQAYHLALGNMDINTMQKIFDFVPERTKPYDRGLPRHKLSIWHKDYRIGPDLPEENLKEVDRMTTKGREITVNVQHRKRPREEDALANGTPTDDDLTSMYCTPTAKRKIQQAPAAIPETPSPAKTSQQIMADKLLEKARSPKRPPRRLNMFAVKGRNSERRLHLLKTDRVNSRFFSPPKEPESKENTSPVSGPLSNNIHQHDIYKMEEALDDDGGSNDEELVKREWAYGNPEPASKRSGKLSTLDKLQQYKRTTFAPALPTRIKDENDQSQGLSAHKKCASEAGVNDVETVTQSGYDGECEAQDTMTSSQSSGATPKARSGAFSWGGLKKTKSETGAKCTPTLDMFKRVCNSDNRVKMKWKREQNCDVTEEQQTGSQTDQVYEEESVISSQYSQKSDATDRLLQDDEALVSQESESQLSYSSKISQGSEVYSMDADNFSYSQLVGNSKNSILSQDASQSQDIAAVRQSQDLSKVNTNQVDTSKLGQTQSLPKLPSPQDNHQMNLPRLFASGETSTSLDFYSPVMKSVISSRKEDLSGSTPSYFDRSSKTDCEDRSESVNSSEEAVNSRKQKPTMKASQKPTLKRSQAATRLQLPCKPPGLSKRKRQADNASRQTTMFSFMKKSPRKNEYSCPL